MGLYHAETKNLCCAGILSAKALYSVIVMTFLEEQRRKAVVFLSVMVLTPRAKHEYQARALSISVLGNLMLQHICHMSGLSIIR